MSVGDTGGSFLSKNTLLRQTGIIAFCFYSQETILKKIFADSWRTLIIV